MQPWIGLTAFSLVLDMFNIGKVLVSLDIANAIARFIGWVLGAYFFLVVRSFKAEVEAGETGGEALFKREEREMLNA